MSATRKQTVEAKACAGGGCHGGIMFKVEGNDSSYPTGIYPQQLFADTRAGDVFEITVTRIKRGPAIKARCLNPWPAHYCDDGIHRGPYGKLKRADAQPRTRICAWCDQRVAVVRGVNAEHRRGYARCKGSGMARGHE